MPGPPTPSDINRSWLEIGAVVLSALGKILLVDVLDQKFWFIIGASVIWLVYVIVQLQINPSRLSSWGFTSKGFYQSLKFLAPWAGLVLVFMISSSFWTPKAILNWHLLPVLVLYPIWGTIQHFLLIAIFAQNLKDHTPIKNQHSITAITALLFALIHYPSYELMGATFLLAIVYVITYFRYRNLWALGLFHGWLGALFYYLVLGRDTWAEFIKAIA